MKKQSKLIGLLKRLKKVAISLISGLCLTALEILTEYFILISKFCCLKYVDYSLIVLFILEKL